MRTTTSLPRTLAALALLAGLASGVATTNSAAQDPGPQTLPAAAQDPAAPLKPGQCPCPDFSALDSTCPGFVERQVWTQTDMNRDAVENTRVWERRLRVVTGLIERVRQEEPGYLRQLSASRQAWQAYRDAQLALYFPGPVADWGSSYGMGHAAVKSHLTHQRIHDLLPWLQGEEEGVVGGGSVPIDRTVREQLRHVQQAR